ncbi:unnamed protein product [Rodentolepis nana]|uniref:DUF4476 domain-containing protein n=1 Tax=Rodentolepis nana TaxID=102285 RepID=A0A0R3TPW1_RODNA|nr:unnamed protein product [Rodentolepis nana]
MQSLLAVSSPTTSSKKKRRRRRKSASRNESASGISNPSISDYSGPNEERFMVGLNETDEFIRSLKKTDKSLRDFEFDCHQAAQLFFHESNETRFQIRGFLLDYENDIKLLAPYSPFVASALQILPLIHAEMAPTMHSAGIYDHYNERKEDAADCAEPSKGV